MVIMTRMIMIVLSEARQPPIFYEFTNESNK